ncbi:GNAT family N-acetyltransferase [Maricaulis sp.]|uniref:GNAT family N-acetyltransferase n=1 Tax=Maricaulis sp. TaxID=1486257 RepID=UPI003A902068
MIDFATVRPIHTERLTLRGWRTSDLGPFAAMNADPEVMRHFPACLDRAGSDALVERQQEGLRRERRGLLAAETREDGVFIGFIGIMRVNFGGPLDGLPEIGWRLARAAWGQGYASEGARACLAHAFASSGEAEIVAVAPQRNAGSLAVMRKIGMQRDPADDFEHPRLTDYPHLQPCQLYRITRARWDEVQGAHD